VLGGEEHAGGDGEVGGLEDEAAGGAVAGVGSSPVPATPQSRKARSSGSPCWRLAPLEEVRQSSHDLIEDPRIQMAERPAQERAGEGCHLADPEHRGHFEPGASKSRVGRIEDQIEARDSLADL
jgi:hypothetical protein